MDIFEQYMGTPDEKPLERLISDAGFCGIFKTVGCIGDSLSSGEFESMTEEGINGFHDMYEYSWAKYITNMTGAKLHNFSKGGMNAEDFYKNYSQVSGAFGHEKLCQCYIMALGVNDMSKEIGDPEKVSLKDPSAAGENSFAMYYLSTIKVLKYYQPDAKFFLMTIPRSEEDSEDLAKRKDIHAEILRAIEKKVKNVYVLDFRKYAPVYYTKEFRKNFCLGWHLNPMGYIMTGKMVASYIDYIIRHNMEDFKEAGFIGTQYKYIADIEK